MLKELPAELGKRTRLVGSAVTEGAGTIVLFLLVGDILLVCLLMIMTCFHGLLLPPIVDGGEKGFKMKR